MKFSLANKGNTNPILVSDRKKRLRSSTACAPQRIPIVNKGGSHSNNDDYDDHDYAQYLKLLRMDDDDDDDDDDDEDEDEDEDQDEEEDNVEEEEDDEDDGDVDAEYKMFLKHLREDGKSYVFETVDSEDGKPVYVKYEQGEDDGSSDEVESDTPSVSSQTSGQIIVCSSTPDFEHGLDVDPSLVDDSYQTFLSRVRMQGHSMVFELENGVSVVYEEEEEEDATRKSTLPSVKQELVDEDDGISIECINCSNGPGFKEKLMNILKKPFKQDEYERLLKEATSHKPLERQRILRGRSVSYVTEKRILSYLDHHRDLAKLLESADDRRSLTLLRGFFFWLQNLSHEGAYKPWDTLPPGNEIDCEEVNSDCHR